MLHYRKALPLYLFLLLTFSLAECSAATIYVKTTGSDSNDGSNWGQAKQTIQSGINAASSGDEVWVARGTYVERVTLPSGVSILGGYAGTGTTRDIKAYVTTIDANKTGSVITVGAAATNDTRIDGFTITNGSAAPAGGGVDCHSGSCAPTISNNVITNNAANQAYDPVSYIYYGGSGGAVYGGSPRVINNLIKNNTSYDVGVVITAGQVQNNIIVGNTMGVYCTPSTVVTNNTIVDNRWVGVFGTSGGQIANNIVAFNSTGIQAGGTLFTLQNNCVYGNGTNYKQDQTPGPTDIQVDPQFADARCGNFHITSSSPCRNAGADSVLWSGALDMDGQVRVEGTHVDMGADESYGESYSTRVIRVKMDGNDANDGSTWALAKQTVQSAMSACQVEGAEVWVKAGTYPMRVAFPMFVHLYGGFAGTETARSQRNWAANTTVIDGQNQVDTMVMSGVGTRATVDGFTFIHGRSIFRCHSSSPLVCHNRFLGNGDGTYQGTSQVFYLANASSPTIADNFFAGNRGRMIFYFDSSPVTVVNNTIVGNGAGTEGYLDLSNGSLAANNIVAFNRCGWSRSYSATITTKNNCVYGNEDSSVPSSRRITPSATDITVDPKITDLTCREIHLPPDSPCINAGDPTVAQPDSTDIDCQPRTNGTVDIGADESYGETWPAVYRIAHVSPSGSDANEGFSWAAAKRTIQAGVDALKLTGGEIWVQSGVYNEQVGLMPDVYIYGGFAGWETERTQRNWVSNETIIDAGQVGCVASVYCVPSGRTCIDGFTLRNGKSNDNERAAGIYASYTYVRIANCNLVGGNPSVAAGGGIRCQDSSADIVGNSITGFYASSLSGPAVYLATGPYYVANNIIAGNRSSGSQGSGIYCAATVATIMNNTIVGNTLPNGGEGGGMYLYGASTVANNIIAFNQRGIYKNYTAMPAFANNCVYSNSTYNYSGCTPGTGDISVDPLLTDRAGGDNCLQPISPCIDAGTGTGAPSADKDGTSRPQDGDGNGVVAYDIGAYERVFSIIDAKKTYPDGQTLSLGSYSMTGVIPGANCLYVEKTDRSIGIRVDTGKIFSEGVLLNILGTLQTDPATGERYVAASEDYPQAAGGTNLLDPLAMGNRELGGQDAGLQAGVTGAFGLNNIGLLVTTWGTVTEFDDPVNPVSWLKVSDGSVGMDGMATPVKVRVPTGVSIDKNWTFAIVTGISSLEKDGSNYIRVIRVRKQGDIVPF